LDQPGREHLLEDALHNSEEVKHCQQKFVKKSKKLIEKFFLLTVMMRDFDYGSTGRLTSEFLSPCASQTSDE
jgi:hypothetical protein